MSWLYANSKKRRITHLVTDIAGAMAIENRTGRPTVVQDNPGSKRINNVVYVSNPTWAPELPIFIVDSTVGWPAKTIMGIDANFAIHRVTSTNASYRLRKTSFSVAAARCAWISGKSSDAYLSTHTLF
jgi:hypothetical protein